MIQALDLFAGAGGWSVACRDLGICEVGVELDEWACKTRDAAGFTTLRIDVERCPVLSHDILIASPPCQGFSVAGKRNPRDPRNGLVFSMWRYIVEAQPTFVAFEQVPLVLPVWGMYARALRDRGAEPFGNAARKALESFASRPAPTLVTSPRSDEGIVVGRQLPEGEERDPTHGGWTLKRPAPTLTLNGSTNPAGGSGGKKAWAETRPATTVCDDRITPPGHRDWGPTGKPRQTGGVRITLQEAAVLQSFPPDFPFQGVKTRQFQQVGNAIPVALARAILATFL